MLRSRWFVPITIFLVCWALTTHGKYSVSGDEPHYLIVTQSLLADGDLDVRNNYAANQGVLFGAGGLGPDGLARETRQGRLFPVHDIGVSVALVPVYAVATKVSGLVPESLLSRFRMTPGLFAYSLVSLFVIGLTCLAAALTRSALIADGTSPGLASGVVLAVWLSPPVLTNSFLVFPEVFALLATAWAVRLAVGSGTVSRASFLSFVLAMGLLPWCHRKYAIYGAAVLLVMIWHQRAKLARLTTSDRAVAVALLVLPQIALAWSTWHHWGSLGGALTIDDSPFSWHALRAGSLGLLVDRENGLFVWAPIFVLLPAAWALTWRRHRLWLLPTAYLFIVSAAHHQWWGGFSPAARFLVPLIPVFTLVGVVLLKDRFLRRASLALLVPQLLISAYCWQHPRTFWPQGDGHNRVLEAVLQWVGATGQFLPSLRAPVAAAARALVVLIGIALVNVAAVRIGLGSQRQAGPE